MTRARDVSRLITTPPNIYATDTETSSAGYLTNASASTIYATISSNKVVQIVYATTGTEGASSSSTMADTGLTATITPTSASNKVLVLVDHVACGKGTSDAAWLRMRLMRNSSDIHLIIASGGRNGSSNINNFGSVVFNYLDTPNTTSATTYKTQYSNPNAAGFSNVQVDGVASTIILMEVTP
jgi:hypothetical protein